MQTKQGSQPPSLVFGKDSKVGRGIEMLYSKKKKKKERLHLCSDWRLFVWEAVGELMKQGSYALGKGGRFEFLCLVLSWKRGQNLES